MFKQHGNLLLAATVIAVVMLFGMWPRHQASQAQEQAGPPPTLNWESLKQVRAPDGIETYRASVPGGWLVCVYDKIEEQRTFGQGVGIGVGMGVGVAFVPDPRHEWK